MAPVVRAIRGATTLDSDTGDQVESRVQELTGALLDRNRLTPGELISVIFTATDDIVSMFPATAAGARGWGRCRSCALASWPWSGPPPSASGC